MIDMLISVLHWCASCAPAGAGVPSALGTFSGAAGAAGGMGGMGGMASGGPGTSSDGNSGTEGSTSDGAPFSAPGSGPSTSSYGSSAAAAAAAHAAEAAAASAASGADTGRTDAVEPDPVGQAIPGLFVGGITSAGESYASGLSAGGIEAGGTATAEGAMTGGEETGVFDAVGDGAKAVGSFFASPFTTVYSAGDFPSDAGPDATLPDAGTGPETPGPSTTTQSPPDDQDYDDEGQTAPAQEPSEPAGPNIDILPGVENAAVDGAKAVGNAAADGAKVVGSFLASPFTHVYGADEFPSDAGPDATSGTGPGHTGATDPDAGPPPRDPGHP